MSFEHGHKEIRENKAEQFGAEKDTKPEVQKREASGLDGKSKIETSEVPKEKNAKQEVQKQDTSNLDEKSQNKASETLRGAIGAAGNACKTVGNIAKGAIKIASGNTVGGCCDVAKGVKSGVDFWKKQIQDSDNNQKTPENSQKDISPVTPEKNEQENKLSETPQKADNSEKNTANEAKEQDEEKQKIQSHDKSAEEPASSKREVQEDPTASNTTHEKLGEQNQAKEAPAENNEKTDAQQENSNETSQEQRQQETSNPNEASNTETPETQKEKLSDTLKGAVGAAANAFSTVGYLARGGFKIGTGNLCGGAYDIAKGIQKGASFWENHFKSGTENQRADGGTQGGVDSNSGNMRKTLGSAITTGVNAGWGGVQLARGNVDGAIQSFTNAGLRTSDYIGQHFSQEKNK